MSSWSDGTLQSSYVALSKSELWWSEIACVIEKWLTTPGNFCWHQVSYVIACLYHMRTTEIFGCNGMDTHDVFANLARVSHFWVYCTQFWVLCQCNQSYSPRQMLYVELWEYALCLIFCHYCAVIFRFWLILRTYRGYIFIL